MIVMIFGMMEWILLDIVNVIVLSVFKIWVFGEVLLRVSCVVVKVMDMLGLIIVMREVND